MDAPFIIEYNFLFFFLPLIIQCDWCWRDGLAELSWRTPSAVVVTVAAFSVADCLYIGHTYVLLLWQDVLPSRLAAAFDHNRHLPRYLYSAFDPGEIFNLELGNTISFILTPVVVIKLKYEFSNVL